MTPKYLTRPDHKQTIEEHITDNVGREFRRFIRKTGLESSITLGEQEKRLTDTMMILLPITNDLNRRTMTCIQAESKIIDSTNQIMIRFSKCVNSMVELLLITNQKKRKQRIPTCLKSTHTQVVEYKRTDTYRKINMDLS